MQLSDSLSSHALLVGAGKALRPPVAVPGFLSSPGLGSASGAALQYAGWKKPTKCPLCSALRITSEVLEALRHPLHVQGLEMDFFQKAAGTESTPTAQHHPFSLQQVVHAAPAELQQTGWWPSMQGPKAPCKMLFPKQHPKPFVCVCKGAQAWKHHRITRNHTSLLLWA